MLAVERECQAGSGGMSPLGAAEGALPSARTCSLPRECLVHGRFAPGAARGSFQPRRAVAPSANPVRKIMFFPGWGRAACPGERQHRVPSRTEMGTRVPAPATTAGPSGQETMPEAFTQLCKLPVKPYIP